LEGKTGYFRKFFSYLLKPRIIFVEPQEDIDEITSKIQAAKNDTVALVIPQKAIIFQSIISVKILRSNADKLKKQIYLVTRDTQGQSFAERLGIPAFPDMEHIEESPVRKVGEVLSKRASISKIAPTMEIPQEKEFQSSADFRRKKQEILELLSRPSKGLVFSICILSLFLLFFVATLALPGATIHINPQKKVIENTINITLTTGKMENATDSWRQHVLGAIPIESVFENTIPFETVTKVFTGENASGTMTVVNTLHEEFSLRPGTRFKTSNGLIFRSRDWIKIFPNSEEEVLVEADESDIFGEFIGARGNIEKKQRFVLPGLPEKTQKYVWAENRQPFSGGVSGYQFIVSEKDIELAETQMQQMVVYHARKDAEIFVKRKNKLENRDLILLPGSEFLDIEVLEVEIPDDILGKNIESFPVHSMMRVKMLSFSKKEMLSILRGALLKTVDPGMELIEIEENSIFPEVLSISPDRKKVKITVSIRGIEAYIIEPKTKKGVHFVNRVKENVSGKNISEAQRVLENFREVATVEISIWPPFLRSLPHLPENISVTLLD
jgi:hypothetical protein